MKKNEIEVERDELIDTIVDIETMLADTGLDWTVSYQPSTRSYMIYILREEDDPV